jgi:hypothetical protein
MTQYKNQPDQPQITNPLMLIAAGLLFLAAAVVLTRAVCYWSQCYLLKAQDDISNNLWLTEYRINT